jgi:hypothetical protein
MADSIYSNYTPNQDLMQGLSLTEVNAPSAYKGVGMKPTTTTGWEQKYQNTMGDVGQYNAYRGQIAMGKQQQQADVQRYDEEIARIDESIANLQQQLEAAKAKEEQAEQEKQNQLSQLKAKMQQISYLMEKLKEQEAEVAAANKAIEQRIGLAQQSYGGGGSTMLGPLKTGENSTMLEALKKQAYSQFNPNISVAQKAYNDLRTNLLNSIINETNSYDITNSSALRNTYKLDEQLSNINSMKEELKQAKNELANAGQNNARNTRYAAAANKVYGLTAQLKEAYNKYSSDLAAANYLEKTYGDYIGGMPGNGAWKFRANDINAENAMNASRRDVLDYPANSNNLTLARTQGGYSIEDLINLYQTDINKFKQLANGTISWRKSA